MRLTILVYKEITDVERRQTAPGIARCLVGFEKGD